MKWLSISCFHLTVLYLSSLWDFPWCCFLFVQLLFLSGFINVPLPRDHGFNWLFDGPPVDLLVLARKQLGRLKAVRMRITQRKMQNHIVDLPSLRRFCMAWAWDGFLHFHPAPHHRTSCFGSGNTNMHAWYDAYVYLMASTMIYRFHLCTHWQTNPACYQFFEMMKAGKNTFSKAHLSWVYSAYLLIKGSSLSGIIVLWRSDGDKLCIHYISTFIANYFMT